MDKIKKLFSAAFWQILVTLVVTVITSILALLASLPLWQLWIVILLTLAIVFLLVNQIAIWRERHKKKLSQLSDKEVKELISKWLLKPYFKLQPVEGDPFLFSFNVDHLNIRQTMVFRLRDDPYYIHIASRVAPPKEVSDILSQMPQDGWVDLQETISLELLRYGIKFNGVDDIPIKEIQVMESIPLADWLTEHHLIERILYVMRAGQLGGGYFFFYAKSVLKQQEAKAKETKSDAETKNSQT